MPTSLPASAAAACDVAMLSQPAKSAMAAADKVACPQTRRRPRREVGVSVMRVIDEVMTAPFAANGGPIPSGEAADFDRRASRRRGVAPCIGSYADEARVDAVREKKFQRSVSSTLPWNSTGPVGSAR